jgi:sigma-B regulation protein RsbU (phosphoserine phosphatase)
VKLKLQSLWKRTGKLEKAFLAVVVLYLILLGFWPDSGFETFVAFAAFVLGGWIALRLLRIGLRKLTWRLRNRLMVAYVFIAVLPILLILTLVGLGGYMLAGQVAVYLVRSELDRRMVALRSVSDDLDAAPASIQKIGTADRPHFPGLLLLIEEDKAEKDKAQEEWPEGTDVKVPVGLAENASGVASRDGRYFAWATSDTGGREAIALVPLTRRFLSTMLPDLGDVYFLQAFAEADAKDSKEVEIRVIQEPNKSHPREHQDFAMLPAGRDAPAAPLPPPVNRFDIDVRWPSLVRVIHWDDPKINQPELLVVHTRLSVLLDAVSVQGADQLQGPMLVAFYAVSIAFLVVGIAGLLIGISMSRSITGAVHSLYEGTQRVMHGDFSHLIPVSGRDQLAELSGSFNTMTQNLERLLAVAKEKERLETEIEIARGVQDQLYPKAPPVFDALRVLGLCHPARMVSGDYYDYQLVDGKLAIAIGDVAGKGISAALLMATIQAALRMELRASAEMAASMNGLRFSTARMVSELNQQLYATTSPEKYATFFFAIFDPATALFTYTNAGHLQPVLIRDGAPTLLEVSGLMVGAFPFAKYEESKLELRSGDLLVCYTDGITEPENEYGEMFGDQRLIELVAKNADRADAEIIASVMEAVTQWTGTPELFDDMTLLLARKP